MAAADGAGDATPPFRPTVVLRRDRPAVHRPARPREPQETPGDAARRDHLAQLHRRYAGDARFRCREEPAHTVLQLPLTPSDPDFPYAMEVLILRMVVPQEYPVCAPRLTVLSQEVPATLRTQIEWAWHLTLSARTLTLLQGLHWLDRNLETLLVEKPGANVVVGFVKPGPSGKAAPSSVPMEQLAAVEAANVDVTPKPAEPISQDVPSNPAPSTQRVATVAPRSGTEVRLYNLMLQGVSLTEVEHVTLLVKCVRCKEAQEVAQLSGKSDARTVVCTKCRCEATVRLRPVLLHANNATLGYLDVTACLAVDLLSATLTVTCATCDRRIPSRNPRAFNSVMSGSTRSGSCAGCHAALQLGWDHVKLIPYGSNHTASLALKTRAKKPAKDEATLAVGQPLPKQGACAHYGKSHRWFRFPCCGRLYPCDVCHEAGKRDGHEMTRATRAVCGFCSREQQIRSGTDTACVCGRSMVRSSNGTGFWEGGRGTRNPAAMSRHESRKYAGHNKTVSMKAARVGQKHPKD